MHPCVGNGFRNGGKDASCHHGPRSGLTVTFSNRRNEVGSSETRTTNRTPGPSRDQLGLGNSRFNFPAADKQAVRTSPVVLRTR